MSRGHRSLSRAIRNWCAYNDDMTYNYWSRDHRIKLSVDRSAEPLCKINATIASKLLKRLAGFRVDSPQIAIISGHDDCLLLVVTPISDSTMIKPEVCWSAIRIGFSVECPNCIAFIRANCCDMAQWGADIKGLAYFDWGWLKSPGSKLAVVLDQEVVRRIPWPGNAEGLNIARVDVI